MKQEQVSLLIEEHLKTIYAYSLSRVSNKEDAEDLAGDIVLAILQSAPKMRDDHAFFGYIWAIAANTYKKYLRKRKAYVFSELDETLASDEPDILDEIYRSSEINKLRRELSILSKEHRECTVAYYIDGLSSADTSKKLGISLPMVKYYLFKTRKILKEGISMEREFGERSYNPSVFEFVTIFSGQFNREYRNLFNRKLPGNILVSAYYTPMTVRELAIELGVASVYLEDEIALLTKYGLVTLLPQGKVQTNLVIFTEAYHNEFVRTVERDYLNDFGNILKRVKKKLPEIRTIGFYGSEFDDNHLLWSFLFDLIREGHSAFEKAHPKSKRKTQIIDGATGTNYGVDHNPCYGEYGCDAFAGYAGIDEKSFATFANFGILPQENHYHPSNMKADLSRVPRFSKEQKEKLEEMLSDEISSIADFYDILSTCAVKIMKEHAPKALDNMTEEVIEQTIFFRTVGMIGALAVHCGEMNVPKDNSVKPIMICNVN